MAGEAIELLNKSVATNAWKTHGIAIIERHSNWLPLNEPLRPKCSRKKKESKPELPPEVPTTDQKSYVEGRFRLAGRAAEEFVAYLYENEPQLRKMAEEEKLQREASERTFKLMAQLHHRHE